jgi:hypothetical protein
MTVTNPGGGVKYAILRQPVEANVNAWNRNCLGDLRTGACEPSDRFSAELRCRRGSIAREQSTDGSLHSVDTMQKNDSADNFGCTGRLWRKQGSSD